MSDWKASEGHVVLFPTAETPSPQTSAHEAYRRVWGGEPDSFQRQPNPLLPAVAQGRRGSITAVCVAQPARVDFILRQTPRRDESSQSALPLIENADQLRSELANIVERVGEGVLASPVIRVALIVQFLSPSPNLIEANKVLASTIPSSYGLSITDEEDVVFQVNRPYVSGGEAQGVKMNSLRKWSVDRIQVLTMAIPAAGMTSLSGPGSPRPQTAEFIAASVSLDINNVPAEAPLSGQQQSSLLHEALGKLGQLQEDMSLNVKGLRSA